MARALLDRLGLLTEGIVVRRWPGGAGLFVTAPVDGLLAATELCEQAWALAQDSTEQIPSDTISRLLVHLLHERRPRLVELAREAESRRVSSVFDDDSATVGAGAGSRTWPLHALPDPATLDWTGIHDVPVALITGSNGKTTTARLLTAMLARSGRVVGLTSTDGIVVGGVLVEAGDWAGPSGARRVLRDPRVGAAVLETARGGLLRRGVATTRAQVAVVTRVAADHFGEYGVHDEQTLGEAKLSIGRVIPPTGHVVLNAEDPILVALASTLPAPVIWFSCRGDSPIITGHIGRGGEACIVEQGRVTILTGERRLPLLPVSDMPIALGGAARYNIANALAATAAAMALGVDTGDIRETLRTFGALPSDNPGRLHVMRRAGVTVVLDFVHNPDGWRALYEALSALPARRRIVVVGQAGDRSNEALHDLAAAVWKGAPALVVLKEMEPYLRGRSLGETSAVLTGAFRGLGAMPSQLRQAPDELSAIRMAIALAEPGDLVILGVHEDYDAALAVLG